MAVVGYLFPCLLVVDLQAAGELLLTHLELLTNQEAGDPQSTKCSLPACPCHTQLWTHGGRGSCSDLINNRVVGFSLDFSLSRKKLHGIINWTSTITGSPPPSLQSDTAQSLHEIILDLTHPGHCAFTSCPLGGAIAPLPLKTSRFKNSFTLTGITIVNLERWSSALIWS